ncbi:MAG TPA: 30S ribosomal protein S5 [Candidatus Peribacterales bacterium]|nr:30S ribosomal protein S5 [Candidatus Peribacterales bacterium]
MAKSSKDDRRKDRGGRRERDPKEYDEHVLQIARVTRVVKGGRRMRFRATVIIGNRKGRVGLGIGKSAEVQGAVQKAVSDAKRHMINVPIVKDTIPHEVNYKFKAARIRLLPAMAGTGIIAGGALRPIFDLAGVKNVLSKRYGSSNIVVNAQTAMQALTKLRKPKEKVEEGGKEVRG